MSEKSSSPLFSSSEIEQLKAEALLILKANEKTTREQLFDRLYNKIGAGFTKSQWLNAASIAINQIPELEMKRGRFGVRLSGPRRGFNPDPFLKGIVEREGCEDSLTPESEKSLIKTDFIVNEEPNNEDQSPSVEIAPILEPKPYLRLPNSPPIISVRPRVLKRPLKVGEINFEIPGSNQSINDLIINVFDGVKDPDGNIEFEDQKYSISDEAKKYLDKFLFYYAGATQVL